MIITNKINSTSDLKLCQTYDKNDLTINSL
jgi:hypothetical protein